jgi:hypothetical protein
VEVYLFNIANTSIYQINLFTLDYFLCLSLPNKERKNLFLGLIHLTETTRMVNILHYSTVVTVQNVNICLARSVASAERTSHEKGVNDFCSFFIDHVFFQSLAVACFIGYRLLFF